MRLFHEMNSKLHHYPFIKWNINSWICCLLLLLEPDLPIGESECTTLHPTNDFYVCCRLFGETRAKTEKSSPRKISFVIAVLPQHVI